MIADSHQFYHRPRFASSAPATRGQFSVGAPLERSEFSQTLFDIGAVLGVVAFVVVTAGAFLFAPFALLFCSF